MAFQGFSEAFCPDLASSVTDQSCQVTLAGCGWPLPYDADDRVMEKVCGGELLRNHVTILFIGGRLSLNSSQSANRSKYIHHEVVPKLLEHIWTGWNNDYLGTFRNDYDNVHCDPTKLGLRKFLVMKHEYCTRRGKIWKANGEGSS